MSDAYSLRAVDEAEPATPRGTTTARKKLVISAWVCAGLIWLVAGTTDVSEFGIWTVLAVYLGIAAIFGGAAARVHYRSR